MFDLEEAIKQWRKALDKNEALEDGYREELESHLRDKIDHLTGLGSTEKDAFEEAVKKIGNADRIAADYFRTDTRHLSGRPPWEKNRWAPPLISNYFKTGWRKIKRQKTFSLINIAGLAVGLACCAVIILYVTNELTYDRFHPGAGRIFRVAAHKKTAIGETRFASTAAPLAPVLKADYPQVENAARIVPPFENASHVLVVQGEKRFFENRVWFVDPDIFQLFRIPFLRGDAQTALANPYTAVITEGMASKYFGDEPALGKTLRIEIDYDTGSVEARDFEITGIVKNAASNTHFKYDLLLSMATMLANIQTFDENWVEFPLKYTYVKLVPSADAKDFEKQIQRNAAKMLTKTVTFYEFFLQPVMGIHMNSRIFQEIDPPGNWSYISIYSIIAFLVLLIGCMNFINLSAALSSTRTREVGLRKVVGAQRRQLMRQFLGESFLITILAFIVAFGLAQALLFPFNRMAGTELSLAGLGQPVVLLSLLGLLVLVGLGSGFYPAVIVTAFKPVSILQDKSTPTLRGSLMQKTLVVGQFAISVFLVISTLTVFKQLDFMRGRALGFDVEQKLILRVKSNLPHLRRDYESIKADFLQNSSITGAAVSSSVPGDNVDSGYYMTARVEDFKNAPRLKVITVDYDFLPEYGIKMIAGRSFQRNLENDPSGAYVINLAAVKALGFTSPQEALGKEFMAHYHRRTKRIIGVTDNFHYRGMKDLVEPLILDMEPSLMSAITLSVRIEKMNELMGFIRSRWDAHFPGVPFEYSFLDENFDREYRYEEQMGRLLGVITTLGILIACLGLFGLASFVVQRRKKEIGIRKVLGASPLNIVSMLSKKYVWLILGSVILASPPAWLAMNHWLRGFAYRVDQSWAVFVVAAAGALAIALATVCIHGVRAAAANPADSLHTE